MALQLHPALDQRYLEPERAGAGRLQLGQRKGNLQRLPRRARAVGATVIGDFHRSTPGVRRLLPFVDHPLVPLEFAESRGEDPRRRSGAVDVRERKKRR